MSDRIKIVVGIAIAVLGIGLIIFFVSKANAQISPLDDVPTITNVVNGTPSSIPFPADIPIPAESDSSTVENVNSDTFQVVDTKTYSMNDFITSLQNQNSSLVQDQATLNNNITKYQATIDSNTALISQLQNSLPPSK